MPPEPTVRDRQCQMDGRLTRAVFLESARLTLVPSSPAQLLALMERPERFEELAGFPAADGLRDFFVSGDVSPQWLDSLRAASGPDPWRYGFFVVERERRSAIGSAGYKGPPDSSGKVEIAYGIVPGFEGRGYASEAAHPSDCECVHTCLAEVWLSPHGQGH